jgi:hypothetical protein
MRERKTEMVVVVLWFVCKEMILPHDGVPRHTYTNSQHAPLRLHLTK